ncbi:MAG: RIP metalloprotease RseP [Clostridia bacterium]|nr:RIP metalloprotease RseP [Clostridia bacterium]
MQNFLLSLTAASVWGKVWPILFAILFFGIIIALHEFGHFSTAKLFRIKVNEFSIGMGPAVFKKQKGETLYALRILPIGGFVSLEGEDEASEDPRAFGNQKAWKRFIVIAAGATLNIILGLVLIGIMLTISGSVPTTTVSDVTENMYTAETGVLIGDKIISIDGTKVHSARDLYYCLYRNNDGKYDIVLKRNGEKLEFTQMDVIYDMEQGFCSFVVGNEKATFLNIIPGSVKETASMTKMIWLSLIDMFRGNYSMDEISGPVGTIGIVANTASDAISSADYSMIIFMLAFITVNIGIVNLLPLPALDGGRLFFIFIEVIFRRPVPKKFEAIVHAAGLILLLGLMALITFNDISNLIKG